MTPIRKTLRQILVFFGTVNILGMLAYARLGKAGLDPDVFLVTNLFVCVLTLFSLWMLYKGAAAASTTSFMTSLYGSFLAKLVLAALAVVVYAQLASDSINIPAILGGMVLYFVYTIIEVKGLIELITKK